MKKYISYLLSLLVLFTIGAGSSDYLGPDRTRTTYVLQRQECYYTADGVYTDYTKTPPTNTHYGCHVYLYTTTDSSCPSSAAGYFNPGPCGWPPQVTCASMNGCSYGGPSSSTVGCSGGDQGCRSTAVTTTYPEAAVSANILCSNPGANG
jgi:hypothetical protein